MQYKLIAIAPLLAVVASAAFAAGPEDTNLKPGQHEAASHCDAGATQDLVFNARCGAGQRPVRVAVKTLEQKTRLQPTQAKRITQLPWQTGIFQ